MFAQSAHHAFKTLKLVLGAMIAAGIFRMFVLAIFLVPSQSMLPGLLPGDHILATKSDYGWSTNSAFGLGSWRFNIMRSLPARGDVVLIAGPKDPNETFLKRVMGLPGDKIALRDGIVYLNGKPLRQQRIENLYLPVNRNIMCLAIPGVIDQVVSTPDGPRCAFPVRQEQGEGIGMHDIADFAIAKSDQFPEITVPAGHLFLLGDNRDDSLDSRFSLADGGLGLVPAEKVFGRVRRIVWSTDGSVSLWRPWTWSGVRSDRFWMKVH